MVGTSRKRRCWQVEVSQSTMCANTLLTLAEFSLHFGFIGIDEYIERCEIASWLNDDSGALSDPRNANGPHEHPDIEQRHSSSEEVTGTRTGQITDQTEPDFVEFLFQKWVFTKSDPDPYPATPHGHLYNQTRRWPKLNPYTGRAFRNKHQEDISLRLNKRDMITLWNDEKFRDFCRSHILWYAEQYPYHSFPVSHPLRFPRWK